MAKSILVVGHGPIGHSFIEKMTEGRSGSSDYQISVLCEEPRPAYNRVMLTQYFQDLDGDKHDKMKLSYVTEEELKELKVTLLYGRAISIDREAKTVSYMSPQADQKMVGYDILVMATGSFCFVPPVPGMTIPEKKNVNWPDDPASRPEGVFVYRTIEDLESLLEKAKLGAKRAVVIGGGLLGLEAAKAVYDLKMESHVLEMAPYLMPTQLNDVAGQVLLKKIKDLGVHVHCGVQIKRVVCEAGTVAGIELVEQGAESSSILKTDLVIVSCGIRPRDELAKQCGLEMGVRGGIKVDSGLKSSDDSIYAIGEVAAIDGKMCYGLWAPGVEQAEALAQKLLGKPEAPEYLASDLSTKLKLLGVEVASFGRSADFWFKGQYSGKDPSLKVIESKDDLNDTYRRLFFSADGSKLMGGILIGDAKDYSKLLQLSKKDDLAGNDPVALAFKLPPPGASSAVADGGDGTGMTDDDLICTCLALSKGQVRNAIIDMEAYTIPLIKKACKAGTGCGGCCTPVGEVPKLLAHTLKKLGKAGASGICSHFKYSRKELFDIVKVKELKSLEEILSAVGQGSPDGCELCKPVVASILSGLWNDHALKAGRDQIQEIQSPYHDKRQRINDKRNISMMRVYLAMTTSYCMISFESLNKYIYANYLTSCF